MAREVACQMVESFCSKDFQRKKQIIEMLTTFLGDMSHAGEAAQEFVHLYQRLITPDQVRLLPNLLTTNMAIIQPFYLIKMGSVTKLTIFGLKMAVKSCLEFFF